MAEGHGVLILLIFAYLALNKLGCIYDWTNGAIGTEKPVKVEKAVPALGNSSEAPVKPATS